MFEGTKYATCFPIGTMEVVMNFKPQTLRDYYESGTVRTFRVLVVGDIDVDAIEAQIKKMFSDIPAQPANNAKREYYPVNDNKEPIT